jgi:hypothetical protein
MTATRAMLTASNTVIHTSVVLLCVVGDESPRQPDQDSYSPPIRTGTEL